jgi:8-oxo-dGTP pyrophosphatase MutT (NUDIX family)
VPPSLGEHIARKPDAVLGRQMRDNEQFIGSDVEPGQRPATEVRGADGAVVGHRPELTRPSARVLLFDDADRLFLFCSGYRADGTLRWYSPGGGLEPSETHEEAAKRELHEETGLTELTLSREVWRGRPWVAVREGVEYLVEQRYFMARVLAFDISSADLKALESTHITGYRWWTTAELSATTDILRPDGLADLVTRLLTDVPPDRPITVDG